MITQLKENWGLFAAAIGLSGYAAHLVDWLNNGVACLLGVGALILVILKIKIRWCKLKAWERWNADESKPGKKHHKLPAEFDPKEPDTDV